MRIFSKVFKIKMLEELQYKTAFISGIICQFAFGYMYIMIYSMFFESGVPQDFNQIQMASYIWLGQAFFALFSYRDNNQGDITTAIKNGNVSYQMIKPIGLYKMWFFQVFSKGVCACIVRSIPMFIIAALLPKGTGLTLPVSFAAFCVFAVAIILGSVLICSIKIIIYTISLITLDSRGVFAIAALTCEFLGGALIPIPLMPSLMQKILSFTPFRYVNDLAYRVYIGSSSIHMALVQILIQILWIVVITLVGYLLLNKTSKKIVVQGG